MNQVRTSQSDLPQPLRVVASGLRRLPGAGQVSNVTDGALDWIGTVPPRGRRMAVYTGAAVLGLTGVVEWPVALAGVAVAWLTQARPGQRPEASTRADAPLATPPRRPAPMTTEPGPAPVGRTGAMPPRHAAGDRLAPSHFRPDHPEGHVHEQPAKVGDAATTSGLKQVAEASAHHHDSAPSEHHPPHGQSR
nr:hypothetical protein [Streptomyces incarnatus]